MKQRIFFLFLALLLLTTSALAAGSTGNFVHTKAYSGQFSDVSPSHYFYPNIVDLYEYGLTVGNGDGTFGLDQNVTVGNSIIFAARLRSLYFFGDAETGAASQNLTGVNYQIPYLAYLKSENVIGSELDTVLNQPATRAQMAHILANALPEAALPRVHDALVTACYASGKYIPDVTASTPYQEDILTLYRCGVLSGSDNAGSFAPNDFITRGAVAAMLTRMANPALRITLDWSLNKSHSLVGITYADLVKPAEYIAAPQTAAEIDQAIRYAISHSTNTLTLQYAAVDQNMVQLLLGNFIRGLQYYSEQGYNTVQCSYNTAGKVTLTFTTVSPERTEAYRQQALEAAIRVHDTLVATGTLREDMSELQKAKVLYHWLATACAYDTAAADTSTSHLPYSALCNQLAVCDGYTGAYNLLLKLEGIQCYALANDNHMWTVAVLDGEEVHIDATWGDAGTYSNDRYFAMSSAESYKAHPWHD